MKIIRHLKGFKKTSCDADQVMYCEDEKGTDWYSIVDKIKPDSRVQHVLVGAKGLVHSVSGDIQRLWPAGFDVVSVETSEKIKILDTLKIEGTRATLIPFVEDKLSAEKARAVKATEARIQILERAQRHKIASPQELEELKRLEVYSVELMRCQKRPLPKGV